jgi:APA family basic amino acid/polyamine antiporter
MVIGFVVYFFYGRTHSRLAPGRRAPAEERRPSPGNTP